MTRRLLSFLVANLIRTEERRRQYLLELTDTVERLSELLPLLEEQVITLDEGFPHVLGKEDLLDWISELRVQFRLRSALSWLRCRRRP